MKNLINKSIYYKNKFIKKFEKIIGFSIFFISPLRFMHVVIERIFIFKAKSSDFLRASNYILKNPGNKKINIISAGIGNNIDFENFLFKNFNIKKLVAIDPTSVSKKIVKQFKSCPHQRGTSEAPARDAYYVSVIHLRGD